MNSQSDNIASIVQGESSVKRAHDSESKPKTFAKIAKHHQNKISTEERHAADAWQAD
jgi:hypothetical protein